MENLRIERAKLSLEGLNIGDCFGENFFSEFASFQKLRSLIGKTYSSQSRIQFRKPDSKNVNRFPLGFNK